MATVATLRPTVNLGNVLFTPDVRCRYLSVLILLGTTLFVEFFHVAGERARVLCSSFVNHYHFHLLLDQRKLILWMKIRRSNNIVLRTLSGVNYHEF